MTLILRNILKGVTCDEMVAAMPRLQIGMEIALDAEGTSVGIGQAEEIYKKTLQPEGFPSNPILSLDKGEASWIEFVSEAGNTPLDGIISGSHMVYGSAVDRGFENETPFLELYAFYAVVDGEFVDGQYQTYAVSSISVSPVSLRLAIVPSLDETAPSFMFKPLGAVPRNVSDIVARDRVIHNMALQQLVLNSKARRKNAEKALQALPSWLTQAPVRATL